MANEIINELWEDKHELIKEKNLFWDKVIDLCEKNKLNTPDNNVVVKLRNIKSPQKEKISQLYEFHYGKILSVRFIFNTNKKSGLKKFTGIGYIIFANWQSAEACVKESKLEFEGQVVTSELTF